MEYRTLGSSGVSVSTLALGTMTFGTETDEAGCHAQLDRFVEAGGNLVDTADVYSSGGSEEIIGRWLAKQPPESRPGGPRDEGPLPDRDGPNDLGLSRRHLPRALDACLDRLGGRHDRPVPGARLGPLTPIEETLRFLDDAVRQARSATSACPTSPAGRSRTPSTLADLRGWPARSPCSRSTTCSPARSSGRSCPPARPKGSACCRGRRWAVDGSPGKYHRDQRPTGATRLGENPNRGMEAYDRRPRTSAPGTCSTPWRRSPGAGDLDGPGGARLAGRPAHRLLGDPRRPHPGPTRRQPRRRGVHLSDEEIRRLDQASDPGAGRLPLRRPRRRAAVSTHRRRQLSRSREHPSLTATSAHIVGVPGVPCERPEAHLNRAGGAGGALALNHRVAVPHRNVYRSRRRPAPRRRSHPGNHMTATTTPTAPRSGGRERHRGERSGWLRAAVLGADDGIVSVASIAYWVSHRRDPSAVFVAALAALTAGAMSMAAGEYVSVSSQRDTELGDLAQDRNKLAATRWRSPRARGHLPTTGTLGGTGQPGRGGAHDRGRGSRPTHAMSSV